MEAPVGHPIAKVNILHAQGLNEQEKAAPPSMRNAERTNAAQHGKASLSAHEQKRAFWPQRG